MKMTMKTFSAIMKPYKQSNEHFYLLNFFTTKMVVINYRTMMSVIVVICQINCDSFYFLEINITKDDGRSLFINMPFVHQIAPLYFA